MVTKVEVNGYEIVIEEKDGVISVSALKDEEVVEEFELETEEGQGFDDEDSEEGDVQGFDEFGQDEEEDFDSDEDEDFGQDDEESEDEDEDVESKLESFQSFINKRK